MKREQSTVLARAGHHGDERRRGSTELYPLHSYCFSYLRRFTLGSATCTRSPPFYTARPPRTRLRFRKFETVLEGRIGSILPRSLPYLLVVPGGWVTCLGESSGRPRAGGGFWKRRTSSRLSYCCHWPLAELTVSLSAGPAPLTAAFARKARQVGWPRGVPGARDVM